MYLCFVSPTYCRSVLSALQQIDEDGNGYIMIGELHGLAKSLGLAVAPEEQDEALEAVS